MKKVLTIVLTTVMVLSLTACGGNGSSSKTEEKTLKVGDTAEGKICNVTVNSVDFVDKITDGAKIDEFVEHNGIVNSYESFEDVTAENGYSIVKISYSFDYTGKAKGNLNFGFTLDYDGYTFDNREEHALPKEKSQNRYLSTDYSLYYTDDKTSFEVTDPISYKGDKGEKYIIISDEAKKDTDKPYVLKVNVSLSDGDDTDNAQKENFVFDLR